MGLKSPPSSVNLPGGHKLVAHCFRITKLDAEDRPVGFEPVARGDHDCILWASPAFTGSPLPDDLLARVKARLG